MSEIKPVYQVKTIQHGWKEIPEGKYQDALDNLEIDGRILYPAAAYEALQKEVAHWKASHADLKERLHVATHRTDLPSDRLPLFDEMKAEIAVQAELMAELEEESASYAHLIYRQSELLSKIAITLKGEPAENTSHSHHDLPELVEKAQVDAKRYEKVRRLNAYQFQNIFKTNITSCIRFDELVDNLPASKNGE